MATWPRKGARRRGGVRRKNRGWQGYIRLHAGKGGLRTKQFDFDTDRKEIQDWIDDEWQEYRRERPTVHRGTLAADAPTYLKLLVDRPKLMAERAAKLAWWCRLFGDRRRGSLKSSEIETALNGLLAEGFSASYVKHYRTALFHLFTKLDGRNASNPLRDVPPPRQPDPLPRAMPYAVIDAIFDAMPDRRWGRKLTDAQAAAVRHAARQPGANASAIAREAGISETMVRTIARSRRKPSRDALGKTKARLQVMAYVGLPPAQLMAVTPADVNWDEPSVLVLGRKKGGGTRPCASPSHPVASTRFAPWNGRRPGDGMRRRARGRSFSRRSIACVWRSSGIPRRASAASGSGASLTRSARGPTISGTVS